MAEIYWPFPLDKVREWPGARGEGWSYHVGTDFAVPQGTPLRATVSGTVDIVWNDGYGAWIINIIAPDGTVIRNGHMSYMHVKDGQWVNAGDYIGNTGGAVGTPGAGLSTGSHLHWEIRTNNGWGTGSGDWYDPRNLLILSFDSDPNTAAPPLEGNKKRIKDMATLYYTTSNNKRAGKAGGINPTYYLAGDAPGTDANWLPVADVALATELARSHGDAVWLTKDTKASWEKQYKQPLKTRAVAK